MRPAASVERTDAEPCEPFERRLLGYLAACVETESTEGLVVARDTRKRIVLSSGEAPLLGGSVPLDDAATAWAQSRMVAARETVIGGWPLVTGWRPRGPAEHSGAEEVLAPVLYAEVRVVRHDGGFAVEPVNDAVEVSPEALRLLGVPREERERLVLLPDELDPSLTMVERLWLLIEALSEEGVLPDGVDLDPLHLEAMGSDRVLHNAAVCFVSEGDRAVFTRALLRDLRALIELPPEELRRGPLGILLGRIEPPGEIPVEPLPVVTPTNAEQELAATMALRLPFAVVTGPPGTGKTQVLVNVAAAAVAEGRTVLLASKNNHAIDVVHERLHSLFGTRPVRTGTREHQKLAAASITAALDESRGDGDRTSVALERAQAEWERTKRAVVHHYDQLAEIDKLERRLDEARRALDAKRAAMPAALSSEAAIAPGVDEEILVASHQLAVRLLDELDRTPDRWGRRRRRRRAAEAADSQVRTTLALFGSEARDVLIDILLRQGPRAALAAVADVFEIERRRERVRRARHALDLAPARETAWAAIDASLVGREKVGKELVRAAWEVRLRSDLAARAGASAYAQQLASAPARSARERMADALGAFPVWAVTSLSAGTCFPLMAGLFDIVVIDEASQSDLASAMPLLYRAKHALVVGDPNQLTHITTLSVSTDVRLARTFSLSEEEHSAFSYKTTSLFAAAERALERPPLLLRQHFRSHPEVIGFSNRAVYGGQLVVRTPAKGHLGERAVRWCDVRGPWERSPANRSVRKPAEAEVVVRELLRLWRELPPSDLSIGVVSPFRAQVDLVRDLVARCLPHIADEITVDTAHGFQGDERDVMLFSTAVAPDMPPTPCASPVTATSSTWR